MISFSQVSSSGYYTNTLEKDGSRTSKSDNYYSRDKAESEWLGEGARLIGLKGKEVDARIFTDMLNGKIQNPKTDKEDQMIRKSRVLLDKKTGEKKVAEARKAWDFTISAPKAVSIAALVGGDDRVVQAHREAVRETVQYLQKNAAQTRFREGSETIAVKTDNLTAALFHHETSRSNDANLHTHAVIMNATYDNVSEKWRALSNEKLLELRSSADQIYKQELNNRLIGLGYKSEIVKDGNHTTISIEGITKNHEAAFSTRSAAIDKYIDKKDSQIAEKIKNGEKLSEKDNLWNKYDDGLKNQIATLATRAPKDELSKAANQKKWNETAEKSGLDLRKVIEESMAQADKSEVRVDSLENAMRSVGKAISDIAKEKPTFTEREIIEKAIEISAGRSSIKDLEWAVRDAKRSEKLIDRPYDKLTTPGNMQSSKEAYKKEFDKLPESQKIKALGDEISADYQKLRSLSRQQSMHEFSSNSKYRTIDANIRTGGLGIIKDRYVITDKGVYRSDAGILNIKNSIAHAVHDIGKSIQTGARLERFATQSLTGKALAGVAEIAGAVMKHLGAGATSYKKVGAVEAGIVRGAHLLQKASETRRLAKAIDKQKQNIESKKADKSKVHEKRTADLKEQKAQKQSQKDQAKAPKHHEKTSFIGSSANASAAKPALDKDFHSKMDSMLKASGIGQGKVAEQPRALVSASGQGHSNGGNPSKTNDSAKEFSKEKPIALVPEKNHEASKPQADKAEIKEVKKGVAEQDKRELVANTSARAPEQAKSAQHHEKTIKEEPMAKAPTEKGAADKERPPEQGAQNGREVDGQQNRDALNAREAREKLFGDKNKSDRPLESPKSEQAKSAQHHEKTKQEKPMAKETGNKSKQAEGKEGGSKAGGKEVESAR